MARSAVSKRVSVLGGKWGQGVFLNGSSAFSIVDHADLKPTGAFSIGGWFNSTNTKFQNIFQSYSSNTNTAGIYLAVAATNGNPQILSAKNTGTVNNTDYKVATASMKATDGLWHFIVGTWDTANLHIYVDGVEYGTGTTWANAPAYAATNYPRVGCGNASGTNNSFCSSSLDDVFLFNGKALSLSEVQTLYNNELRNTSLFTDPTLKFYSRFNDMSTDDSGNNHSMTMIGTPAPKARRNSVLGGKWGRGILLNGSSAFSAVDGSDFKPTTAFSISAWTKTIDGTVEREIFQSFSANTAQAGFTALMTSGKLRLNDGKNTGTVQGTDYQRITGSSNINDGVLHHVVTAWDGSYLYLYVDGKQDATPVAWANAPQFAATNYVRVGCSNITGTDRYTWQGVLDDVAFFKDKFLSITEIQTLYTNKLRNTALYNDSTLKAYYTFDPVTGMLVDSSPNNHTLTAIGTPSYPMTRTSVLGGRWGSGVYLNGSSAYSAVDGADWQPTGNFSVGCWFNTGVVGAQGLVQSYSFNSNKAAGWRLETYGAANYAVSFFSGKNTGSTNGVDLGRVNGNYKATDGLWHFAVGTWDGSKLHLYVDGVEQGTGTSWANAPVYQATNYVRVGNICQTGSDSGFLIGKLDKTFIFNGYALTASDVMNLYLNELSTTSLASSPYLKAYYKFNNGALTTDSSGNGHTLTAIGSPVVTTGRTKI